MPELQELPDGYTISYAEDPVWGGWFADIRRPDGTLAQTGCGATKDEALQHASARLAVPR